MRILGIGACQSFENEEKVVEIASAPTANTRYFQDRNPESTFAPFFNRALRAEQEKEMLAKKKIRDLRVSEDYKLLKQTSTLTTE